ncbi:transcriptional regulator, SarA/Rot family, partial [Anaerosporobacter sp.]|uniref:transcriptional regulator, SarA/Rot family n=1 Tax=Anaerosporobacter sp. TaxID=1872529 RepID=UPI00286FA09B
EAAEIVSLFCRLRNSTKNDLPIRSSEMGLLILLHSRVEPITPLMAAEFFKVKKPMITAMITSLVSKGYMQKTASLEDKRSFTINLTQKGMELVEETKDEYFKSLELLSSKMGENDFNTMITMLDKANKILLEVL